MSTTAVYVFTFSTRSQNISVIVPGTEYQVDQYAKPVDCMFCVVGRTACLCVAAKGRGVYISYSQVVNRVSTATCVYRSRIGLCCCARRVGSIILCRTRYLIQKARTYELLSVYTTNCCTSSTTNCCCCSPDVSDSSVQRTCGTSHSAPELG